MAGVITPLHYSLTLDPLLEQGTFSGEVAIEVALRGAVESIELDSSGLEIGGATIDGHPATVEIAADRLKITPAAPLESQQTTVSIAFHGHLHRGGRGFFMSGGCAVTQLQPAYARMLFPCFDDPAHKTTFDINCSASRSHTAVTNAPLLRDEIGADRHRMTFARSARLPTHLLGLAIGPFRTSELDAGGLTIRLLTLRQDVEQRLLLEIARDFVHLHGNRLAVPYPWPRLDLVAIPEFEAAGIETTSVLYFRESAVLLDGDASVARRRQRAALVAHELAHQWFGSLVTPATWKDLWLNEGFATWLSARAVADRDEGADDAANVRAIRAAMAADSLPSSRALRTAGQSAAELHELYDDLTYWKGAAILRMLEAWLGEETFWRGVTLYLTRHAGGHASSADLWRALDEVAGRSVTAVAEPFVEIPGVPALRFSSSGPTIRIARRGGEQWTIPVVIKAGLADGVVETKQVLLGGPSCDVQMQGNVTWLFGNAGAAGYYRCSYDDLRAVPPGELTGGEAVALLSDLWDELWSGAADIIGYLRGVKIMSGHPSVSETAEAHLSELEGLLAGGARHEPFRQWISSCHPAGEERRRVAPAGFNPADLTSLADDEILPYFENSLTALATRPAAWDYLKANWDALQGKVVSFGGRGAITALAAASDRSMRNDIARFFAGRATGGAERTLLQTLERIDGRIRFREREQLLFDCWLTREASPAPVAVEPLRHNHALVNMLAAGFHGALVHRNWLEALGLSAPEWMQPAEALVQTVTALERRLVAIFNGAALIDAPLLALAARLQEDLLASSELAEGLLAAGPDSSDQSARALAAVLARQGVAFERLLRGAISFTDLFGDDDAVRLLRMRLAAMEEYRARTRRLLDRVASGETTDEIRRALWNECAGLPSLQRSEAAALSSLVSSAAAKPLRPAGRDS